MYSDSSLSPTARPSAKRVSTCLSTSVLPSMAVSQRWASSQARSEWQTIHSAHGQLKWVSIVFHKPTYFKRPG